MRETFALVLALCASIGCTSYAIPYRSADFANTSAVAVPRFAVVVDPPVWDLFGASGDLSPSQTRRFNERFIRDLKATGLFESVESAAVTERPGDALVIRPAYVPRHCFAEPLFTVLTLGVIPYPGCANAGYKFLVDGPQFHDFALVDTTENVSAIWGWISGPLNLLPGRSREIPSEREVEVLRAHLSRAIASALAGESPPAQHG